ncbi:hypothetical protein BHE97_01040 [Aeromicrobium sp. PE09-221]|uniref:hypothetical protein n=1 Tax=Aeromicrobium sp. PE09-221 TaxID=1898043 RepID=UPI000B3EA66B|nr:hypothetical protein [Aeromicrobium sp. PE09-221]OUZ12824.1 hypothetical protein BHE97_01040 [Aeromicrobium sp. PE09-221]
MKSKSVGVLAPLVVIGGLSFAGGTVTSAAAPSTSTGGATVQAAIYSCGPSCYTDDPTWKPGKKRSQY